MTQPGSTPQSAAPTLMVAPTITLPLPQSQRVPLVDVEVTDANGAVNETVRSMETVGQTDRIVLEQRPGQPYAILDGKRRVINARKLNWPDMAAEVYPPLTSEQRAHLKLSLHRRAPNKVDEAKALTDLARAHGISVAASDAAEQLARIAGMKVGQVRRYLKFMHLPTDVIELIGTTISEGVAEGVASLQGRHRDDAILAIRSAAADDDGRFTGQDLKDIQMARASEMGDALNLGGPLQLPQLLPLSPVQALASDVRILASERNIRLEDLIQELQNGDAPVIEDPFLAAFGPVTAVPAPAATAPVVPSPLPTAQASPWETLAPPAITADLPVTMDVPVSEVSPVEVALPAWEASPPLKVEQGEREVVEAAPVAAEQELVISAATQIQDIVVPEAAPLPSEDPIASTSDTAGEGSIASTSGTALELESIAEQTAPQPASPTPAPDPVDAFSSGLNLDALFGTLPASAPEATPDEAPAPVLNADGSTTEQVGDVIVTNYPARKFIPGTVPSAPTAPGGRSRPGRR